jgi:hypothetical protein
MKRIPLAMALLLVFGATAANADRWVPSKRLPKPVDFPQVRKNVREYHKAGKRQNHPPSGMSSLGTPTGFQNA